MNPKHTKKLTLSRLTLKNLAVKCGVQTGVYVPPATQSCYPCAPPPPDPFRTISPKSAVYCPKPAQQ